jgi:transposase
MLGLRFGDVLLRIETISNDLQNETDVKIKVQEGLWRLVKNWGIHAAFPEI